jgi:hypothetical protein
VAPSTVKIKLVPLNTPVVAIYVIFNVINFV